VDISTLPIIEPEGAERQSGLRRPLERTHSHAMASVQVSVSWTSDEAQHTDIRLIEKLNLWRDIIPPELEAGLMDRPRGHALTARFPAGQLVAASRDGQVLRIKVRQFDQRFRRSALVHPRVGRFYPQGILKNVPGVYTGNMTPFRVVEVEPEQLTVDLNHPLAGRELEIGARLVDIWEAGQEHGGACNDLAEMATASGPGIQARWRGRPTDFWSDLPFVRVDPTPDDRFYTEPRLVHHLDATARRQIRGLHGRLIPAGARVLDLMTSWESHLPERLETGPVTGLGMNGAELQANPRLAERVVHDLNLNPRLPFGDRSFDAVICTASVEYLTEPFDVFEEVARVLNPCGIFVVSFSNRRFPPKVIRIWEDVHEFERPGLVLEYFLRSGRFQELQTYSLRGLPRPADDKYAARTALSDPVYAVWGQVS
jgi:hypothetical protein